MSFKGVIEPMLNSNKRLDLRLVIMDFGWCPECLTGRLTIDYNCMSASCGYTCDPELCYRYEYDEEVKEGEYNP